MASDLVLPRDVCRDFDIRWGRSTAGDKIADALTGGTERLTVDGVLLVAEHGNYPRNEKGQVLYPRYEIFEQVVDTFRRTGQTVPVFVANLVFAGSFKGTGPSADVAFASNLIGIMLGGMLEYASLLIGYRHLLLIVIGFYVLSALLLRRREPATSVESEARVPVAAT